MPLSAVRISSSVKSVGYADAAGAPGAPGAPLEVGRVVFGLRLPLHRQQQILTPSKPGALAAKERQFDFQPQQQPPRADVGLAATRSRPASTATGV